MLRGLRASDRRFPATAALAAACAFGVGVAQAQDIAAEFAAFRRPAAPVLRTAVAPTEWERIARPVDRFGPRPLREVDARMLDAARAGRWPEVLELVARGGADPGATDPRGINILTLAARAGQFEAVRDLLRHGAAIDRRSDDGFTPLGAAALRGHVMLVRQLLKAGADPAQPGITGQTPMHLATLAGQMPVVDAMLRAGVPIDLLNTKQETALELAESTGQLEVMQRLLAAGADASRARRR
jgi:hypothetical protein